MNWVKAVLVVVVASVVTAGAAEAAKCSSTGGGFKSWKKSFALEAKAQGVKPKAISALMGTSYSKGTIRADRGQHGFKLSLKAFMAKRGADGIIAEGGHLRMPMRRSLQSLKSATAFPRPVACHMGHGDRLWRLHGKSEYPLGGGNPGL